LSRKHKTFVLPEFYQNRSEPLEIETIISKAIESNECVHYFAMKTIAFYAVRIGILDIAADFDEKFRNNILIDKKS